jgi:hypothetical protein
MYKKEDWQIRNISVPKFQIFWITLEELFGSNACGVFWYHDTHSLSIRHVLHVHVFIYKLGLTRNILLQRAISTHQGDQKRVLFIELSFTTWIFTRASDDRTQTQTHMGDSKLSSPEQMMDRWCWTSLMPPSQEIPDVINIARSLLGIIFDSIGRKLVKVGGASWFWLLFPIHRYLVGSFLVLHNRTFQITIVSSPPLFEIVSWGLIRGNSRYDQYLETRSAADTNRPPRSHRLRWLVVFVNTTMAHYLKLVHKRCGVPFPVLKTT